MSPPKLCLIEDDPIMGESLCDRFALEGFAFDWHQDGESALRHIGRESYAAIISDVRLPDLAGDDLFRRLLARGTELPPLMFITAYGSIDVSSGVSGLGQAVRLNSNGSLDNTYPQGSGFGLNGLSTFGIYRAVRQGDSRVTFSRSFPFSRTNYLAAEHAAGGHGRFVLTKCES